MPAQNQEFKFDRSSVIELLGKKISYSVPEHQREFSWKSEQTSALWDDITTAMDDGSASYFLGTVVMQHGEKSSERIIIDGQQRIACLTIIWSAVRTAWAILGNRKNADSVQEQFLGSYDRKSEEINPRLTLNLLNEPLFNKLVIQEAKGSQIKSSTEDKTAPPSNVELAKAVAFYRNAVINRVSTSTNKEDALLSLEEFIENNVQVIEVTVADEASAYLVFETLNDRGMDLTTSDLLKNYLFGHSGRKISTVKSQWARMDASLNHRDQARFLRHYWLSKYGVVRDRDLYRVLKTKFSSVARVSELVTDLEKVAELYAAIDDTANAFWKGYSSAAKENLRMLAMFGLLQNKPLLVAAMECWKYKEIQKLVKVIVAISVRYSIIGSRGTGNIERAYSEAAISIRDGSLKNSRAVGESLKSIWPDDASFVEDFSTKVVKVGKLARYLLAEISDKMSKSKSNVVSRDEDNVNLEHIAPKTPTAKWIKAFPDDEYPYWLHRLGNQTLLESKINSRLGEDYKREKLPEYKKSKIPITIDVAASKDWNDSEIEERQFRMAKVAAKTWRL